jgi:hypothetical protein
MLADVVYDALRPFHLWAQVAAMCALLLAGAATLLLSLSARLSRRWWLGVSVFISCLLVVAFGERSRSAASDLRPLLVNCLGRRLPNCGVRVPELTDATQWVMLLGIPVVTATALGLLAALATLSAERRVAVERAPTLLLATLVAGAGAYLTADGVAGWLASAYLADITQAGDGLGQIPLIQAIFITAVGLVVLAVGLTLMVVGTPPRRRIA